MKGEGTETLESRVTKNRASKPTRTSQKLENKKLKMVNKKHAKSLTQHSRIKQLKADANPLFEDKQR